MEALRPQIDWVRNGQISYLGGIVIRIVPCAESAHDNIVRFAASRNFVFEHAARELVLRGEHRSVFSDNLDSTKSAVRRGIHFNAQPVTLCLTSSDHRAHRYAIHRDVEEPSIAEEDIAGPGNIADGSRC